MKNIPIKLTEQNWAKDTTPVVSVFSWVFNHNEFIRQSIESILMQETTFPVEIIIQDDASNDGTRQIIEEYQSKYPSLFKNILFSENQYSQGKSIMNNLFEIPKGKYIALNHGDDYWIDPLKLQKQFDLIEKNPNCNIVFHNCNTINNLGVQLNLVYDKKVNKELSIKDLINGEFTKTCTVLLRNGSIYNNCKILDDTVIFMDALENGKTALYINEVMSTYRIHEGGIWSMKSASYRFMQAEIIEDYIDNKYRKDYPILIQDRINNFYFSQSILLVQSHFYMLSVRVFFKYINKENSLCNGVIKSLRYFKWFILSLYKKKVN